MSENRKELSLSYLAGTIGDEFPSAWDGQSAQAAYQVAVLILEEVSFLLDGSGPVLLQLRQKWQRELEGLVE